MLRWKARQVEKAQGLAGMERVADGEMPRIDEPDNIPRIGHADGLAIATKETVGARVLDVVQLILQALGPVPGLPVALVGLVEGFPICGPAFYAHATVLFDAYST